MNTRGLTRPSGSVRLLRCCAQQAPTPAIARELEPGADWGWGAREPRRWPLAQASGLTPPCGRARLRSVGHGGRLASCRTSAYFPL